MSNTTLSTLECSVQRLNDALSRLHSVQKSYVRLEHVAKKYESQADRLKKARDSFRQSSTLMRESMRQRDL